MIQMAEQGCTKEAEQEGFRKVIEDIEDYFQLPRGNIRVLEPMEDSCKKFNGDLTRYFQTGVIYINSIGIGSGYIFLSIDRFMERAEETKPLTMGFCRGLGEKLAKQYSHEYSTLHPKSSRNYQKDVMALATNYAGIQIIDDNLTPQEQEFNQFFNSPEAQLLCLLNPEFKEKALHIQKDFQDQQRRLDEMKDKYRRNWAELRGYQAGASYDRTGFGVRAAMADNDLENFVEKISGDFTVPYI